MNSYNLPTVDQIAAYHAGSMPLKERRFLEARMKKNPFVKEVVMLAPQTDLDAVKRISGKVSNATHHDYFMRKGFWARSGTWFGMSSIVLILGLGAFFHEEILDYVNPQESELLADSTPIQPLPDENAAVPIDNEEPAQKKKSQKSILNNTDGVVVPDGVHDSEMDIDKDDVVEVQDNSDMQSVDNDLPKQPVVEDKKKDTDRDKVTTTVLAPKSLMIRSKINPDDQAKSNEDNYPVFGNGGDDGLRDYLKNSLTPIQVSDAHRYESKATISFTVSNKGKLIDSNVSGNIHPTHKAALLDALSKLPKFNSGKTKVKYSIELKY